MRHFAALFFLCAALAAQTQTQPGVEYSSYTLLLVSHEKGSEGKMVGIDKQRQIVFIPISGITKAVNEDGVSPVSYGELLQLLHQLGEDNQRLKAENDHLWKVAENHGASTPVIVQQVQQEPSPDPDAERRQMRMMLLRSMFAPRSSTVNVNVSDCSRTPALCVNH